MGKKTTQKAKKIPPLLLYSHLLSFNLFAENNLKPTVQNIIRTPFQLSEINVIWEFTNRDNF